MSRPSKRMPPSSFLSVPAMQLTSVLLPEPLGPIRPTRSPGPTAKSTPSSAVKPPNRLMTPDTSSIASAIVDVAPCGFFGPLRCARAEAQRSAGPAEALDDARYLEYRFAHR